MEVTPTVTYTESHVERGRRFFVVLVGETREYAQALLAAWRAPELNHDFPGDEEWEWAEYFAEEINGHGAIRIEEGKGKDVADRLAKRVELALGMSEVRQVISAVIQSRNPDAN